MESLLLLVPITALILLAGFMGRAFWFGLSEPPGWGHFIFTTGTTLMYGAGFSIAALMGAFEFLPPWPPISPFWWAFIFSALTIMMTASDVSDEIEDMRRGYRQQVNFRELGPNYFSNYFRVIRNFPKDPNSIPRTIALAVLGGAAFFVGIKGAQALVTALPPPFRTAKDIYVFMGATCIWVAMMSAYAVAIGFSTGGAVSGDRPTLGAVLDRAGQFSTEVGDTVSKLVAFVKGGLWVLLAAFVINLSWPPHEAFSWIIFGLGIVALGKGLSYIGPALKGDSRIKNQSPQGSRLAKKQEGAQAARGEPGNASSLDQRDLNY
jgi:hypothetical protein